MFLVDAYEYLSASLVREDTPWYKQPLFILGVIATGLVIAGYIYYLRKQIGRLEIEVETKETKAKQARHEARQADHKEDIKQLEDTAKRQQKKAIQARQKLNKMKSRHNRLETSIEKANTISEMIDLSRQIDSPGPPS